MTDNGNIETIDVNEIIHPQETYQTRIDEMIKKHEDFKKKWLQLTDQDLFDWVALWESMNDTITEIKSKYYEEKQENDVQKWMRIVELKAMLNDQWKKVHTESTADAVIKQEFQIRDNEIAIFKLQSELLQNKAQTVQEYINIVKIHMKKTLQFNTNKMIIYTKDKIIVENGWKSKSMEIDKILWLAGNKTRVIARLNIAFILADRLGIDAKTAVKIAGDMKPEYETFYSL